MSVFSTILSALKITKQPDDLPLDPRFQCVQKTGAAFGFTLRFDTIQSPGDVIPEGAGDPGRAAREAFIAEFRESVSASPEIARYVVLKAEYEKHRATIEAQDRILEKCRERAAKATTHGEMSKITQDHAAATKAREDARVSGNLSATAMQQIYPKIARELTSLAQEAESKYRRAVHDRMVEREAELIDQITVLARQLSAERRLFEYCTLDLPGQVLGGPAVCNPLNNQPLISPLSLPSEKDEYQPMPSYG